MSKLLDVNLSTEMSQRIHSKATKCFDNTYQAALLSEEYTYVQGFLVLGKGACTIVEYSWLELEDKIIDPTLPHLNFDTQELYYFPAQSLSVKLLKAVIEESQEDYPEDDPLPIYGAAPYEYYGDLMLGGVDYLRAYQAAEAKCQELAGIEPHSLN